MAKKGAFLLGLPLILQISLLACWLGPQLEVDSLAYRLGEIRDTTRAATKTVIFSAAAVRRLDELDNQSSRQKYSNDLSRAQKWIGLLRKQWEDSPEKRVLIDQIMAATVQLDKILPAPASATNHSVASASELKSQINLRTRDLDRLLFKLGGQIPAIEDPKEQLSVQQNWVAFFLICVLLNTCLTMVMLVVLSGEIIGRLAHVVGNTLRFSKDRSILPAETGSDEIARLDQAFHAMAKSMSELKRKQQAIIRYSRDVLCALDSNGRIISVNDAALRLWGYEPRALVNTLVQEIVATDERQAFSARLEDARRNEAETIAPFEVSILRTDGGIAENVWSLKWSQSDRTIVGVAHDVSEHKAAQRFRQELLQMVSHDLRNPLTSIRGFHVMLEAGIFGVLNEEAQHQLTLASSNTTQMLSLINDLLDLEKIEAGMLEVERKETAVDAVLEHSLDAVRAEAEQKNIEVALTKSGLTIFGDQHRLVQVVTNFLRHAIQTSPIGGTVLVIASKHEDSVEISVIDQGPPIPVKKRSTIFDRFQQFGSAQSADSQAEDSGLMLAVSRALVEMHGGKIGVDNDITIGMVREDANGIGLLTNTEAKPSTVRGTGVEISPATSQGNRFWFSIQAYRPEVDRGVY